MYERSEWPLTPVNLQSKKKQFLHEEEKFKETFIYLSIEVAKLKPGFISRAIAGKSAIAFGPSPILGRAPLDDCGIIPL